MLSTAYDRDANALYIRLGDEAVARTEELDTGTLVDVDAAGRVVGIEVIQPDRLWPAAEILNRYELDATDRAMLEVLFPTQAMRGAQARPMGQTARTDHAGVELQLLLSA